MTRWQDYRKCPVCRAAIGDPCTALTGGGPLGLDKQELFLPHVSRQLRKGRG